MKLYAPDKSELMDVSAIERVGNDLVVRGKIFGSMPMAAHLRPDQARAALKLLNIKTLFFLLTIAFRKA